VISVHTALDVPKERAEAGPTVSKVLELEAARWRLAAELDLVHRQRSALLAIAIDLASPPAPRPSWSVRAPQTLSPRRA